MRRKWMFIAPPAILALAGIGGGLVMVLWNWLMPSIYGLPQITFGQALGLLALCRILFGGMGRHGADRSNWSPEAKERFRQAMRGRWGFNPPADESRRD